MRNLECFRHASRCLRKTNTTTKGCLYPDAAKIAAASRPAADATSDSAAGIPLHRDAVAAHSSGVFRFQSGIGGVALGAAAFHYGTPTRRIGPDRKSTR